MARRVPGGQHVETGVFKIELDLAIEMVEKVESRTKIMTSLNMVKLFQSGPTTSASSSPSQRSNSTSFKVLVGLSNKCLIGRTTVV